MWEAGEKKWRETPSVLQVCLQGTGGQAVEQGEHQTTWNRAQDVPDGHQWTIVSTCCSVVCTDVLEMILEVTQLCVLKSNIFSPPFFYFFIFFSWQHREDGIVVANKAYICFCQRSVIECICCNGGRYREIL